MGLDATVYKNRHSVLASGVAVEHLRTDQETGELYPEDPVLLKNHVTNCFEACHYYLDNIATVGYLREEAGKLLDADSIVIRKILYNGIHSGDVVQVGEMSSLEEELKVLSGSGGRSIELSDFVNKIENLVAAARAENNPICF